MSSKQQAVLVGAIVAGVLSTSYLAFINILCCLGVIIGGAVSVQQYTALEQTSVESGDGALLGALTGAAGVVISTLLNQVLKPIGLDTQTVMQDLLQGYMESMQGGQPMPQAAMQGDQSIGMMLVSVVIGMVLSAIFGAIGGAIGAAMFGEEKQG